MPTFPFWRGIVLMAFSAMLSACSSIPTTDPALLSHLPQTGRAEAVPFYPQEEKYCGPATLAAVLEWTGKRISQHKVAHEVYTPGADGTFRHDMIAAARRHGRLAVPVRSLPALLEEVAGGTPVIVFQNLGLSWWPRWHYAVLTGYDLGRENVILNSGDEQNRVTGLTLFERTWRRGGSWALVVLPPDRLPATASIYDVMTAAAGLERAGRLDAAATAYQAIARRWPGHWLALLGLGNIHYRQGDYDAAETSYRAALALDPTVAEVWNNLAYALKKQGRTSEAHAAAQQAVKYGQESRYDATLQEMQPVADSPQ
ncbi:PA2778 family cysteine peptidase [Luteithermobacter gelatinilyticus]|uniref:PA2778 family cysteine peptidase n=1 Tax=Luteithermobacter gelatinilyticus TaxID=2582913 RepID=UPI00143DA761|nr:PA2778 family cysteine peptidase [Luteithermobacter gelatinilyticus]